MKSLLIEPLLALPEAQARATPDDLTYAQGLASELRRREFLSWRAIVRRELGAEAVIGYDDVGGPVVGSGTTHLGVSHGAGRVAVCLSDGPCSVDIESLSRNFERVASRYISPSERVLTEDSRLSAVMWCAKEALYKFARRKELDLLRDLHIDRLDMDAGEGAGRILDSGPIDLKIRFDTEFVAVYIL